MTGQCTNEYVHDIGGIAQNRAGRERHVSSAVGPGADVLAGLVGSGIGPSLSPPLHEREGALLGLGYRYERFDLDVLGESADAIGRLLVEARDRGFAGLNVTHPCKQLVVAELDALTDEARALGAVNTVVLRDGAATGHNTDVSGFRASVRRGLAGATLDTVVLLGAGGAGAAAAHALLGLGTRRLHVVDPDAGRGDELVARLDAAFGEGVAESRPAQDVPGLLAAADGVVHATPTGMAAHPGLPLDPADLRTALWVADLVYRPLHTPLLRAAVARGCRTLDGGEMAVVQAASSLELFTGLRADPARMREHFDELVRAEAEASG